MPDAPITPNPVQASQAQPQPVAEAGASAAPAAAPSTPSLIRQAFTSKYGEAAVAPLTEAQLVEAAMQGVSGYTRLQGEVEQLKKAAVPAPPASPAPQGVPEWNPAWRHLVDPDGFGGYKSKEGYPAEYGQKATAYAGWLAERTDKLAREPESLIPPEKIAAIVDERLKGQLTQALERQQVDSFVAENRKWMVDDKGQATPRGQQFLQITNILQAAGVQSPIQQAQIAMLWLGNNQPVTSPEQIEAARRQHQIEQNNQRTPFSAPNQKPPRDYREAMWEGGIKDLSPTATLWDVK